MTDTQTASLRQPIGPALNQRQATIPQHDVWVAASAGSGKTTVLTNRVLRLLLPDPQGRWEGAEPQRVLCITFTRAAASLMAIRIQKRLGEWAMMDDAALSADLHALTGSEPDPAMMTAARQLFTRVLDVPGGLAIMTIHSFCQSVLGRFPLEAGLSPGFGIIEEDRANDMLGQSITSLILDIESRRRKDLEPAFRSVALSTDTTSLRTALTGLLDQAEEIEAFLGQYGTGETLRGNLLRLAGIIGKNNDNADITEQKLMQHFLATRPRDTLRAAGPVLGGMKTAAAQKTGQHIADWLVMPENQPERLFAQYKDIFLTKENNPRKLVKEITDNHPDICRLLETEAEALLSVMDQCAACRQAGLTAAFLSLAHEAIQRYKNAKRRENVLDFGDLIRAMEKLLARTGQEWVHYKLDEGIDHILVDEAQDTNGHQWEIIKSLSAEFMAGQGRAENRPRSIFVVGDRKQSIFSFHGADPEAFARVRRFFGDRARAAGRTFDPVGLDTSFRTTEPVLRLVDEVFSSPESAAALGLETGETLRHFSNREQDAGLVELWEPVIQNAGAEESKGSGWVLPFSVDRADAETAGPDQAGNLASRMAQRIRRMIEGREMLVSAGRPIEPRDILILVRTRTGPLIPDLVRQLKLFGIAVSGSDRMTLREQIAVEDCLALARFARLPGDDLSLACVLRSPLVRMEEAALMDLAISRRPKQSLWEAVQEQAPAPVRDWLAAKINEAATLSPFDFFDKTLACACPYDPAGSARRAFATCLGPDCMDPLDEFLGFCLKAETDGCLSLEDLVTRLERTDIKIKRELEDPEKDTGNQVRIMTVHASKGLEAPIVFLPDMMTKPNAGKLTRFVWVEGPDGARFPFWTDSTKKSCALYQSARARLAEKEYQEYLRLLYVALTRPKDRLYLCGSLRGAKKEAPEGSWYNLARDAMERLGATTDGGIMRLDSPQSRPPAKTGRTSAGKNREEIPGWLAAPPPPEAEQRRFVQPSLIGRGLDPALSPLQSAAEYRFERGILTHRLFEFLPALLPQRRAEAAQHFLDKNGANLPPAIRENILGEVFAILQDPVFAPVFGPDSLAEVPVTGDIGGGRILSGQIDRLLVEDHRVLIVDFKTNRPSPTSERDIPERYKDQLRAYRDAVSRIYPQREISCALLWTDKALLMPVRI